MKIFFLPAGQGDCILIHYKDIEDNYRNILIDGGDKSLNQIVFNNIKTQIQEINNQHGKSWQLDLIIVTHSDEDHIWGVIKILENKDLSNLVKKVWFNSETLIREKLMIGGEPTQNCRINFPTSSTKSSRQQDYDLHQLLVEKKLMNEELILQSTQQIDFYGLKITILSPTEDKLSKLIDFYSKKKPVKTSKSKRDKIEYEYQSIEDIINSDKDNDTDNEEPNGGSIALLIEYQNKEYLILGDAHHNIVKKGIENILNKRNESVLKVELIKLSHHGSKYNTNKELLKLIECKKFIISANPKSAKQHPDKETLVRIIQHYGIKNVEFYFTYKNVFTEKIFENENFNNCIYPVNNKQGIII